MLDIGTEIAVLALVLSILPLPDIFIGWFCVFFPNIRSPLVRMDELNEAVQRTQRQYDYRETAISSENRSRWINITSRVKDLELFVLRNGGNRYSIAHFKRWAQDVRWVNDRFAQLTREVRAFAAEALPRIPEHDQLRSSVWSSSTTMRSIVSDHNPHRGADSTHRDSRIVPLAGPYDTSPFSGQRATLGQTYDHTALPMPTLPVPPRVYSSSPTVTFPEEILYPDFAGRPSPILDPDVLDAAARQSGCLPLPRTSTRDSTLKHTNSILSPFTLVWNIYDGASARLVRARGALTDLWYGADGVGAIV